MELTAKENLDRSTANNAGILSRVALNDNKAGMGGLDKEKINKIIMEASKGSRFYENEQKREEQVNQRIEKMLQQKAQVTEHLRKIRQQQVDRLRIELEKNRDLSRTIIHIDMDAFYAAVEMKDNPELKDKPMAVGSKSMLSTSNYHARKYGVRAAMPGFIAKKLCPNLIIVPTNFDKYRSVSKQVQEILGDYDPNFVAVSLDEAYLDITEHLEQRQNWPEHKRTYYCHGEGIAPNMMLSKVCSEVNKPNGQYQIPADSSAVMDFVKNLPIRKVPGIGKVTEKMLNALGITTCTELLQQGALLSILFSESAWYNFLRISLGLSETRVERDGDRKSMSTERTFGEISKASEQYSLCRELCRDLEEDLRKEGLRGRTVTLKLKSINFEVKTRACTVPSAISKEEELYAVASEILKTEIDNMHPQPLRLRLMGLRISGFIHQGEKKSNQQSIINFFHTGKSDSPVCSSDSEGIDLKNQTELVETAKKESFFNKKRQQNDQRSFFGQVLEVKQGKCKPVITPSACTMDEMQLKSSGLTPALKVTRICPKCFKRLSISTSEKLKNQIDHCICPTEEAITSKTSCTITRDTSSLENYLENEKNMDLNELNGTEYQENLSQTYLRNTEMDLHEKLERNSLDGELSFTNSTFPIKQSDHQIYLKDHMQLVYRSPRTLKPIKHKAILDEENEFSNHTIEMSAEITHATQKKLQFDLTESNTSRLNQPSFSQLDLSRQGAQQQSDQVDRHSRSKEERLSSQSEEPIGLVCPICNIRQETTDLSLFNKHVDICLNQGVIQELTERSMQPVSTDCTSNGVGLSGFERRSSNSFVRTKRSGSASQQSTTKKVRCKSSINTIDRFFK
ncbi:DNA polymerase kappa isoform X2 [Narcine bancroftii]|uniref:DNA polymerase kappa isoform X2 n=1 Tax=Narcine bancroftii TaxID=1343680 RepID=UPI003831CFF9